MDNTSSQKHYFEISSKHKWYDLKLREVWKYRDLIILFTKRHFAVTYKQTILGPAWLFISPIVSSLIYSFVFGGIANIGTGGVPSLLFYLSGNAIWALFSTSLTSNSRTFTANAGVFGKVYFPRLATSLSNVLNSIVQFGIQMLIVIVFLVYYCIVGKVQPNWIELQYVPLILIHLGLMGMGLGIIISSLTTKYRDLNILVSFGVSLWMYITPVIYPLSEVEKSAVARFLKLFIKGNPVTPPIELFRHALLGTEFTINPWLYVWSIAFTVIVTVFGIMLFNKVERTFMDTV